MSFRKWHYYDVNEISYRWPLSTTVHEMCRVGWEPIGGIQVSGTGECARIHQPMRRRESYWEATSRVLESAANKLCDILGADVLRPLQPWKYKRVGTRKFYLYVRRDGGR
jgi:hypothetical protein